MIEEQRRRNENYQRCKSKVGKNQVSHFFLPFSKGTASIYIALTDIRSSTIQSKVYLTFNLHI
jgi:hypothetical protein